MANRRKQRVHGCRCQECRLGSNPDLAEYHRSINRVMVELDERSRRLFVGVLARQLGRGGIERVVEITGLSRMTVRRGLCECEVAQGTGADRIRRSGGGRERVEKKALTSPTG